jgi:hypothetical protein
MLIDLVIISMTTGKQASQIKVDEQAGDFSCALNTVEPCRWLVKKPELRPMQQAAGEVQPVFHPFRELAHRLVVLLFEDDECQHLLHFVRSKSSRIPIELRQRRVEPLE